MGTKRVKREDAFYYQQYKCTPQLFFPKQIELLSEIVTDYGGLKGMVFPDFIQVYGLDDLTISLSAMELFTEYST